MDEIEGAVKSAMIDWGNRYPDAGYGGRFRYWLREKNPKPYGSFGNGSTTRVSAVGWLYATLDRTREVARATANVSHNHPEGIKGAEALDEIRPYYYMDETCQKTVPEAIIAFLEAENFEDAIRNAVSLGGDTDTLGTITGSIAEAFFDIQAILIAECRERIDDEMMEDIMDEFDHILGRL